MFNKSTNEYERRKRLTGISFSTIGEIIIAMVICSPKDLFIKHKARDKAAGRVRQMAFRISQGINKASYSEEETFYCGDMSCYLEQNNLFDTAARLLFTPHYIDHQVYDHIEGKIIQKFNTIKKNPSEIYFHTEFVTRTYANFMSDIETSQETSFVSEITMGTDTTQEESISPV